MRVIRALHELGVEAVAVYSTADEGALHTRIADRAVRIGPPPAAASYLSIPALIAAAETTGCEAVHPGYGFLSENPDFVRACEENDLVFVGPGAEVMERMGDKALAKHELLAAGVPLVPGHRRRSDARRGARRAAHELGYPVLLKASAGGGGKGMRLVTDAAELDDRLPERLRRGPGGVRQRRPLPREGGRARAPRRGAGALRPPGRRADARRARVLDPAPPPEARRGVALARARRRSCATRWRPPPSAPAARSATRTPARSSSCSARTARSTSSS